MRPTGALRARSLRAYGASKKDAERVATLIVASVDGTVAMCRAHAASNRSIASGLSWNGRSLRLRAESPSRSTPGLWIRRNRSPHANLGAAAVWRDRRCRSTDTVRTTMPAAAKSAPAAAGAV